MQLNEVWIEDIVGRALAEDLGECDVTTEALLSGDERATAFILVKGKGILAGINVAERVFHKVDEGLKVDILMEDGYRVNPGDVVAKMNGRAASIMKAERVALNFLQRLSGIASETNRYVEAIAGLSVRILDTRKTTPGLRPLEKYAVKVGGGENHRMNLSDGILIKDNHLAALRSYGLTIKEIVAKARLNTAPGIKVEVETMTVPESREAAEAGADIIMLDNMSLVDMREAVRDIRGRALIEASGGVTLDNVRAVAETGVDFISIGALIHSAKALDISLELKPE